MAGKRIVEAGAADFNGSVRDLVRDLDPDADYLGTDIRPGAGVDLVCAAEDLPARLGTGRADLVICTEMLEHAADWRAAVAGLVRILTPGGALLLTTRSPGFPYHPHPGDYWRFPVRMMGDILAAAGLEVIRCEPDVPEAPGVLAFARKPAGWTEPASMRAGLAAIQPWPAFRPGDWEAVAARAVAEYKALQKPGELAGLLRVLASVRPQVVVEIGCDSGGTLWAWSQLPGPPRVIGVDLPGGPYSTATWPDSHGAEVIIGNSHHKATLERLRGELAGEQADVLFIDADHTYQGAALDYHAYRPLVRPGGLIVLHDIVPHPHIPSVGVHQLWEEIRDQWPSQEFICDPEEKWGGIGVLVNEPLPAPEPVRVGAR